jgi:TolA-binding protein
MAVERDEPRRGEVIDESGSQYLVTEHPEGVAPAGSPAAIERHSGPGEGNRAEGREGDSGGSVSVMNLAITAAMALIFGLAGAWAYDAFLAGPEGSGEARAAEDEGRESAGEGGTQGAADRGDSVAESSPDRSGALPAVERPGTFGMSGSDAPASPQSGRIDQLAEQLSQLREQLQDRPDPASGSQLEQLSKRLEEITGRLEEIERNSGEVEGLARRLEQRSGRLDEMSDLLDQVESRLTTLGDQADAAARGAGIPGIGGTSRSSGEGPGPGPAVIPRPAGPGGDPSGEAVADTGSDTDPDPSAMLRRVLRPTAGDDDASETALERGVRQFLADDFAPARETFLELLEQRPEDPRIWYFAALATGKATGDWKGEAERLVLRGVDRERAGTFPRVAIDSAFGDLAERQGSEWLRYYRRRADD